MVCWVEFGSRIPISRTERIDFGPTMPVGPVRKDQREKKMIEFTSYVSYRCALYALNDTYLNGSNGRR